LESTRIPNSQNESSFGVWRFIPSHFPSFLGFLLARNLSSPCFGCEPKARVAIMVNYGLHKFNHKLPLHPFTMFLLFGHGFKFLASIWQDVMVIIKLDNPNVWLHACEQPIALFWHVMPMVMQSFVIAQHWNTFWYATVHGGGYQSQVHRFE
jgi:hypothetical protein